jgi:fatty-acyl-CoA synthase
VRAEALQALCAVDLARYKRPKKILFVAEHQIPLTTTGKVKKNEIAQLFHTVN